MTPLFIEYHLSRSITPHRTVNIAWHSRLGRSAAARQAHCDACPQRSIVRSQGRGITREQERLLCFLVCGYSWGNTTRAHSSLKPAPRSRICYLSLHRNLERQRWGRSLSLRVGAQPAIGGAGDREVYSAVFSRVLEAVIAYSTLHRASVCVHSRESLRLFRRNKHGTETYGTHGDQSRGRVSQTFCVVIVAGYRVLLAFSWLLALGSGRCSTFDRPIVTDGLV